MDLHCYFLPMPMANLADQAFICLFFLWSPIDHSVVVSLGSSLRFVNDYWMGDKTKLQLHIMRLHQMLAQPKKSIIILSLIWNNRAKPHLFLLNLEGRHENYLMKTDDFLTVRICFHCALSEFVCQIWLRGTTQVLTLLSTYDSTSTY